MVSFLICLALLIGGYFVYGKVVENTFGPDDRETPAVKINDGVDYVVLPQWKLFMIQLLNIAGLGPIFGAMQGALWGPIVFLWITFGTIFAGAVHDYFSGMMSERNNGASISEISGIYLGGAMKNVMRVFSVVLLVMVGTVFAVGPAGLIQLLFTNGGSTGIVASKLFWLVLILIYYFIATFLSIDKIIGKIYPLFGICLIIMALGVALGIFTKGYEIPEIWNNFANLHPQGTPIWSFMFITVACGAISGFHATQSPLMARCINNEKHGRKIFYGAMIAEGVIGLIWVTLGMSFYSDTAALAAALGPKGNAALVVNNISVELLGVFGGALAVLGVVVLPVTSGDTAFRAARLTIADAIGYDQRPHKNRLMIAVPLFVVGVALNFIPFGMLWRYFGFANQALAAIMLWAAAAYLLHRGKFHWIASVPACFMTAVSAVYICFEKTMGFGMSYELSNIVGIAIALICFALLLTAGRKVQPTDDLSV